MNRYQEGDTKNAREERVKKNEQSSNEQQRKITKNFPSHIASYEE